MKQANMNDDYKVPEEEIKFYCTIILPDQDPEVVLSAIDFPLPHFTEVDVEYDPGTSDLCFHSPLAYLSYSYYLRRHYSEEFDKIASFSLPVVYGEKTKIHSTIPFIFSNDWGKYPRVKLGEGPENLFVVSNRGRDKNRWNLVDAMIFPDTLKDPLEMDDLVNKAYRSSARIKYGNYIRAFQIPYHLGCFPEITPEVRFIQDLERQRLKYKLDKWEDYKAFGPDGWNSDYASLPIRAVQWYDSPDSFGIWIKPGNLWGGTELPPGRPLLLNGRWADVSDLSYYLFSNNYGMLFNDSDPRFVYLRTDLIPWRVRQKFGEPYGPLDQILFNEDGWKKPKNPRKGSKTLPIYDLEEFMKESCPGYSKIIFRDAFESPLRLWTEWLLDDYCYLGRYDIDLYGEKGLETVERMRYMAKLIL